MRRAFALSAAALLMAFLLAWTPQSASGFGASAAEATLWQLLNADRTNNGVAPLKQNSKLVSIARWRSKDLVDRDYFSHTVLGTGYHVNHWYSLNGIAYRSWGENIGYNYGYSDAQSPIEMNKSLMASSGHRAAILNATFTQGGVGAYGADGVWYQGGIHDVRMYTELFLTPKSAASGSQSAAKPTTVGLNTNVSAQPSPSQPLDGLAMLQGLAAHRVTALSGPLPRVEGDDATQSSSRPMIAGAYRVQAAVSPTRGILQALLGTLVGFLFG